jgi:serine/threonine protein kinase HipA of HipAB toxin-antitoxin module
VVGHPEDIDPLEHGLGDSTCRRAAWRCDAYLASAEVSEGGVAETAVLWDDDTGQDWAADLDRAGNPVGIEFLGRLPCRSGWGAPR